MISAHGTSLRCCFAVVTVGDRRRTEGELCVSVSRALTCIEVLLHYDRSGGKTGWVKIHAMPVMPFWEQAAATGDR